MPSVYHQAPASLCRACGSWTTGNLRWGLLHHSSKWSCNVGLNPPPPTHTHSKHAPHLLNMLCTSKIVAIVVGFLAVPAGPKRAVRGWLLAPHTHRQSLPVPGTQQTGAEVSAGQAAAHADQGRCEAEADSAACKWVRAAKHCVLIDLDPCTLAMLNSVIHIRRTPAPNCKFSTCTCSCLMFCTKF